MENRNGFLNEANPPLCRFGPGGSYVTNWPAGTSVASKKPIASVLDTISKMLDTVINEELLQNSTVEKIHAAIQNAQLPDFMEDEIEFDKSNDVNATTVSGLKTGGQFKKLQPMLFDYASGTCEHSGNKQNNSIRAHRRLKRKRPAFSRPWQGTLFEPYIQSVKVA
jgi:hypothetical protein